VDARTYPKKEFRSRLHCLGFEGKPWAADIRLTPDGNFSYASERTPAPCGVQRRSQTGLLTTIDSYPTEKQPRGFNIDPTAAICYCRPIVQQHDDYAIDKATATNQVSGISDGKNPNWSRSGQLLA